jgi:hypothetical protein
LYSAGYWSTWHFFPRFRARSTGTFGTEIKGTPRYKGSPGIQRWVGLGVIADNLINIGHALASSAER